MLTADHGPAVSGAMNTIVATRAGKDLISALASGLLTIGSRFGGALDEAASMFSTARDTGLTPREFVDESRKANKLSKLACDARRNEDAEYHSQSPASAIRSRVPITPIFVSSLSRSTCASTSQVTVCWITPSVLRKLPPQRRIQ